MVALTVPSRVQVLLMSRLHHDGRLPVLSTDTLISFASKADCLTIIAAFYDISWCQSLITNAKVKSTRIVVNGLGGPRVAKQVEDLRQLRDRLATKKITAEIALAYAPGMFHSKLLLIRRGSDYVAFVGSANATAAAMTRNEEIMLRLTGDVRGLVRYADNVLRSSRSIDEVEPPLPRTLIAFFRTGVLYFKATSQLSLTINPFREIEKVLPRKVIEELGSVSLPHSDRKSGIGPFNLSRALGVRTRRRGDSAIGAGKIKRFFVETSLGYWVPGALVEHVEDAIDRGNAARAKLWTTRRRRIEETSLEEARELYATYTSAIRDVLRRHGIRPRDYVQPGRSDPLSIERFDRDYRRIANSLKRDGFFRRLIRPFQRCSLPEMWEDAEAREEFIDSFFGYLEYARTAQRVPHVPRAILDRIDEDAEDRKAMRKSLERALRDGGWSEEWW